MLLLYVFRFVDVSKIRDYDKIRDVVDWLTGKGVRKFSNDLFLMHLKLRCMAVESPQSRPHYLFTVSNSGLLSAQGQLITDTASVTDTCGFNNSID